MSETEVTRFRISIHDSGYYCVSIPRYKGGEVVDAAHFDALVEALRELLCSGIEFDDSRLSHLSVQVDRDAWNQAHAVLDTARKGR